MTTAQKKIIEGLKAGAVLLCDQGERWTLVGVPGAKYYADPVPHQAAEALIAKGLITEGRKDHRRAWWNLAEEGERSE